MVCQKDFFEMVCQKDATIFCMFMNIFYMTVLVMTQFNISVQVWVWLSSFKFYIYSPWSLSASPHEKMAPQIKKQRHGGFQNSAGCYVHAFEKWLTQILSAEWNREVIFGSTIYIYIMYDVYNMENNSIG